MEATPPHGGGVQPSGESLFGTLRRGTLSRVGSATTFAPTQRTVEYELVLPGPGGSTEGAVRVRRRETLTLVYDRDDRRVGMNMWNDANVAADMRFRIQIVPSAPARHDVFRYTTFGWTLTRRSKARYRFTYYFALDPSLARSDAELAFVRHYLAREQQQQYASSASSSQRRRQQRAAAGQYDMSVIATVSEARPQRGVNLNANPAIGYAEEYDVGSGATGGPELWSALDPWRGRQHATASASEVATRVLYEIAKERVERVWRIDRVEDLSAQPVPSGVAQATAALAPTQALEFDPRARDTLLGPPSPPQPSWWAQQARALLVFPPAEPFAAPSRGPLPPAMATEEAFAAMQRAEEAQVEEAELAAALAAVAAQEEAELAAAIAAQEQQQQPELASFPYTRFAEEEKEEEEVPQRIIIATSTPPSSPRGMAMEEEEEEEEAAPGVVLGAGLLPLGPLERSPMREAFTRAHVASLQEQHALALPEAEPAAEQEELSVGSPLTTFAPELLLPPAVRGAQEEEEEEEEEEEREQVASERAGGLALPNSEWHAAVRRSVNKRGATHALRQAIQAKPMPTAAQPPAACASKRRRRRAHARERFGVELRPGAVPPSWPTVSAFTTAPTPQQQLAATSTQTAQLLGLRSWLATNTRRVTQHE